MDRLFVSFWTDSENIGGVSHPPPPHTPLMCAPDSSSNETSSDKINCSSDDQSDRRERGYDDIDGTSSRPNRSSTFLLKLMIIDVTILAADFMFPSPWHPMISLPRAPETKVQTQKSRSLYRRENVHWTMFSRFATPKNFSCVHTLDTVSNVQSIFSANVQSFCQGLRVICLLTFANF